MAGQPDDVNGAEWLYDSVVNPGDLSDALGYEAFARQLNGIVLAQMVMGQESLAEFWINKGNERPETWDELAAEMAEGS